MYRKGKKEPIVASISDTAAQRDFYSKPSTDGTPVLDDLITDYEQTQHLRVDELRKLEIGDDIPTGEIAELVTHLAIRTSHIRGVFKDALTSTIEKIFQLTLSGEINGQKISFPKHRVPPAIETSFVEELEKLDVMEQIPFTSHTLAKLLYFAFRENPDEPLELAKIMMEYLIEELTDKSANIIHQSHTSALTSSLAPELRVKMLSELKWTVVAGPKGGAILPDCTSVAFDGEKWMALILVEKIKALVLPLTPERMALGISADTSEVDLSEFNKFAAHASHMFFLSSSRNLELEDLLPKLGVQVFAQVSNMISLTMMKAVEGFISRSSSRMLNEREYNAAQISWTTCNTANQLSIPVTFYDFENDTFLRATADVLTSIIASFAKDFPVSGLAGFVFANDYKSALNSIDRGFDAAAEISPIEDDKLLSVGMPLIILEEGEVKTKVVLRSIVADGLFSEDEEIRSEFIGIIWHMLARAALTRLMTKKFPDQTPDDEYEKMLFSYTDSAFADYFCASISCLSKQMLGLYENLAHESLVAVLDRIPVLHRDYQSHGEMERLFPESASLLGNFLMVMARLAGTMQCQGVELVEDAKLACLLRESELFKWYKLFRSDLESFKVGLEAWVQFKELLFVNRHFERLAAQFGLIPEPTDLSGAAYVHVTRSL